jgi:acylphosphatase
MGPAPQLAELKRRLEAGPPAARVTGVEQEAANVDERYRGHFTVEFEGGLW